MSTSDTLITAEKLLKMSSLNKRSELVRGRLVERGPVGARHGHTASRVNGRLGPHVMQNGLGEMFANYTGFWLERDPDTVRAPYLAFVSRDRLPPGEVPVGFLEVAPDLVVEVVSPSDTAGDVQAKLEQWLRNGARLVWMVYPDTRSVAVYRALDDVRVLTDEDQLSGDPVLPGFSCPVSDIF